ncbi:MAG: DUF2953 domain-containing protein [Candidatus Fimenecus sp.]
MVFLYILLGIIALIVLLLSVKVRIDAEYIDDFRVKLRWLFLSFDLYPMQKKEKKPKEEKPAEEKPPEEETPPTEKKPNPFKTFYENQGFDGVMQLVRDTADAVGSLMKSVKKHLILDELYLWVVISHNHDAAQTAIEYGQACQQIFPAMGFICSNLKVKKYDVEVEPDFIGTFSSAQFSFSLSVRPIFLIHAAIVMAFRLLFKVILKIFPIKSKSQKHTENNTNNTTIEGGATI